MKEFQPSEPLSISQYANKYRYLSAEASSEPGKYYVERAWYQKEMMDAINDPTVKQVVLKCSSQVGKTEILLNILLYFIAHEPAPILYVMPTLQMAQALSKDRIAPMIRDNPILANLFGDPKSKDGDNSILHKRFNGGHLTICGANSSSSLSSRPVRIILLDEVSRYPHSAGSEGDPVNLAVKRSQTFWNSKIIMVSTPTIKGACRIDNAFETSDKRFFKVPCPDCGEYQVLKWKNVRWDKDKPETAEYCCEHCGTLWNDPKRWRAVRKGIYEPTAEFNGVAGFHISELYSSWSKLSNMTTAFLEAKKFPDQLKTFINLSLGETWEDKGDSLDENELLSKREDFDKDTVPEDVLIITAGVDVQDTSLHISYLGFTKNEIIHVIHHEVLNGDPSTNMLWLSLDKQLNQVFTRKDGKRIKVASACIDSGGHFTQSVYAYCKNRFTRRFFAIKGMSGDRAIFPKRPSMNNTARIPLFMIGVDSAKDLIFNRVRREGLIKFSNTLDQEYFAELISERVVTRFRQGSPIRVYERTKRHNEALDCFVYAFASFMGLNPNFKVIEMNINKQQKEQENQNETRPKQKTIVRNNFINSWDK